MNFGENSLANHLVIFNDEEGRVVHGIVHNHEPTAINTEHIWYWDVEGNRREADAPRVAEVRALELKKADDKQVYLSFANPRDPDQPVDSYYWAIVEGPQHLDLVEVEGAIVIQDGHLTSWSRNNLITAASFYPPGSTPPMAPSQEEDEGRADYPLVVGIPKPS